MSTVRWHDIECGAYRRDLSLWLELADRSGDPVLDIGAGTGRVALTLATAGHEVIAVDNDPVLVEELGRRAAGLPVRTALADARDLKLPWRELPLCIVPMQTIQLLGGQPGRLRFLESVRAHLAPGGVLAMAVAERVEEFEVTEGVLGPLPDVVEDGGVVYCSQPTAVRREGESFVLHRRRETVDAEGRLGIEHDRVVLDRLSAAELQREGVRAGLRALPSRRISATREHVASVVVMLGA
jgi:SAM-dependent methyltransferase